MASGFIYITCRRVNNPDELLVSSYVLHITINRSPLANNSYSFTSISTPDGKSSFIKASIVLEEG